MMQQIMKQIEQKTCLRFSEHSSQPSGHHLEIQVLSTDSCAKKGFRAAVYAEPPTNQKVREGKGLVGSYRKVFLGLFLTFFGQS